MSAPRPITQPDLGVRTHSAYDLEKVLVAFTKQVFEEYRLDNSTLNLAQATAPDPRIVHDPDEPPVSYDPTARAQTLYLKVPPRVERGCVPRTVTGEIQVDRLPDCPAIILQATGATTITKDSHNQKTQTVKFWIVAYDENPNGSGYQDCLNMVEQLETALIQFRVIDEAYPLLMPVEWRLVEADTFPHFIVEMTTSWQVPAARPWPTLAESIIPGEHLRMGLKMELDQPDPYIRFSQLPENE
jgi:hypothetical protein